MNGRSPDKRIPVFPIALLFSAVLFLFVSKSSPLYPLNDWVDVNIYCTIGRGLFDGLVPYRDLFDQKGPYVYLIYGLFSSMTPRSFFGVYLLETLSFAAFLTVSYHTLTLFLSRRASIVSMLALGGLVAVSFSIAHGGSLEQILLPVFGYGIFSAARYFRLRFPEVPRSSVVFANGLLAGVLLLSKFTMLGFYFAWMATLAILLVCKREYLASLRACGTFLGGMLLACLPWVVYFAANGALGEAYHYYFYINLFSGYSMIEPPILPNMLSGVLRAVLAGAWRNFGYSVPILIGLVYVTLQKRTAVPTAAKLGLWAAILMTAFTAFMSGFGFRYYFIPLAAFAVLGFPAIAVLTERLADVLHLRIARVPTAAVCAVLTVGFVLIAAVNCNKDGRRGMKREETPQFAFAEHMERVKTDDTLTLFCRSFPDSGFYFAADVTPECRFFTSTNVPLPEAGEGQIAYIEAKRPEFIVLRGDYRDPPAEGYQKIDEIGFYYEGDDFIYQLYQRTGAEK